MTAASWAADVVSSNIVGYEKVSLTTGYNMIGVQFAKVGGDNLDLSTVCTLDAGISGFDEDGNYSAMLQIWNGNGYDFYGWSGSSGTDILEDSSMDNLWLEFTTMEPVDDTTATGSGFWIKSETAGTMTISGEVNGEQSVTIPLNAGYNIVASPFPVDGIQISEFGKLSSDMPGFDEDGNYDSMLQVWNGNGYDFYGWSGSSGTDILEDPTMDNLWLDFTTMEPSDKTVSYGHAVWIKAGKAGSVTFTAPTSGN